MLVLLVVLDAPVVIVASVVGVNCLVLPAIRAGFGGVVRDVGIVFSLYFLVMLSVIAFSALLILGVLCVRLGKSLLMLSSMRILLSDCGRDSSFVCALAVVVAVTSVVSFVEFLVVVLAAAVTALWRSL